MRWLLLDEVLEIKKGIKSCALSHIPDTEISQEVLLIEMIAQTGGLLLGAENNFKDDVVFAKIEAFQFPLKGHPREVVEIIATPETLRPEGSWIEGIVKNSRGVFAQGKLMLMNVGSLVPGRQFSTTFPETFMKHFQIRSKVQ